MLLRYALGDLSVRTRERCPHCGAVTDRLIRTPSRVDDLVKVKGMLINPSAILSALDDRLGARPYQLRVLPVDPERPLAGDRLVLFCSGGPGTAASEGKALSDLIKQSCGVTPEVLHVDATEIQSTQASWKAKKFVDLR
jgi:phenylacetate-coenzyme A ligase PaaK-like adenylate-forming protein